MRIRSEKDKEIRPLLKQMREGSEDAFQEIYEATYSTLYYTILHFINEEYDTQDILQETYIKIYQKSYQFAGNTWAEFFKWSGIIAANTALDFLRKKKPLLFSDLDSLEDISFEVSEMKKEAQPELILDKRETAKVVRDFLDVLSDEQRVCVVMFYLQELSIREIASCIGCSENTVKSRLNYARQKMREQEGMLQKRGIILHGVAPLPILGYLLRREALEAYAVSEMAKSGYYSSACRMVMQKISGQAGAAGHAGAVSQSGAAGQQAGTGSQAGSAGQAGTGSQAGSAGQAGIGSQAGSAGAVSHAGAVGQAMGAAAKTGGRLAGFARKKALVYMLTASVSLGGGAGGYYLWQKGNSSPRREQEDRTAATAPGSAETPETEGTPALGTSPSDVSESPDITRSPSPEKTKKPKKRKKKKKIVKKNHTPAPTRVPERKPTPTPVQKPSGDLDFEWDKNDLDSGW